MNTLSHAIGSATDGAQAHFMRGLRDGSGSGGMRPTGAAGGGGKNRFKRGVRKLSNVEAFVQHHPRVPAAERHDGHEAGGQMLVNEAFGRVKLHDAKHGPQISPRQDPEKFHAARERRKRSMAYGNAVSPKGKSPGTRKGKAAGGFF